jgi:hypothetical protein
MPSHIISQKQDIEAVKSGRLLKLDLSLLQSRSGLSSRNGSVGTACPIS